MPCSATLTGHRLYTRPGTPEVPGLGPPRRVALGDTLGGEVPLVGVEAELAACGGLHKMGKEKHGRGRMGSRGCLLSSLIAPALSDRPRPPSQGRRRSQGRLGPKNTGAG